MAIEPSTPIRGDIWWIHCLPTLSALYFDESSQLFLGSVWDWSVVQKGLFLFLASLVSFYVGYNGSAYVCRYRFIPAPGYKSAQTMADGVPALVIFSIGMMEMHISLASMRVVTIQKASIRQVKVFAQGLQYCISQWRCWLRS